MMLRRAGALGAGRAAMRGVQRARVRRRQAMEAVRCQSLSHSTTSPRSTADDGQMTKAERRREEILRNEVEVVTNATSASCLPEDWNAKVLLVDKPLDWTSFDVCGKLRRLVRTKKVGHAGTLDPQATGLLIVCVGRATKTVEHYQGLGKAYVGTMRLGEETSSYDHCTPVTRTDASWTNLKDADLSLGASSLVGPAVPQMPPMYSAIKVKGKRLYELARRGIEVEREARPVRVDRFEVWRNENEDPRDVNFSVDCGKGTYVRSLVHDLGRHLGTFAHMTSLRRTRIGKYAVEDAWDLADLVEALEQRMDG